MIQCGEIVQSVFFVVILRIAFICAKLGHLAGCWIFKQLVNQLSQVSSWIKAIKKLISLLIKFLEGPASLQNLGLKVNIRKKSLLLFSARFDSRSVYGSFVVCRFELSFYCCNIHWIVDSFEGFSSTVSLSVGRALFI